MQAVKKKIGQPKNICVYTVSFPCIKSGILKKEVYLINVWLKKIIENVKQILLKKNSATLEKLQLLINIWQFMAKCVSLFCVVFVILYVKQANFYISLR